jgi:hypothetical protein
MHEQREEIERFWREVDRLRAAAKLAGALVEREWPEADVHDNLSRKAYEPSEF